MRVQSYLDHGVVQLHMADTLDPMLSELRAAVAQLQAFSSSQLLDLFDRFAQQILQDERTRRIDGLSFLATWLRRNNLEALLELNLNGDPAHLDAFVPRGGRVYIKAQPAGVVCQWLAGNVPTLVFFSLVPSLLAKNPTLVKLQAPDPPDTLALLRVLQEVDTGALTGMQLLQAVRLVYFDYTESDLNAQMSLNADCKVMWGGESAIKGITTLPRQEHCSEIVFGPKYSIGLISKDLVAMPDQLDRVAQSIVRDVIVFDQRACSSPQTLFVEGDETVMQVVAEALASAFRKAPAKPGLDSYTAVQIMNTRARYGLDLGKGLIQSERGNDWTICLDPEPGLKEAVQSRTLFLVPIESWRSILELLSPRVQTIGIAFSDEQEALDFSHQATLRGVARCVRFGLMNLYESPWDGKLMINQLVRWVTCKP